MRNPARTDSGTPLGGWARSYLLATLVFLPVVLFVVFSIFSSHASTPDTAVVWVADQKQLKRVDLATNQYVQAIALANAAEAIAFDAKSNVLWALANKHLLTFNSTGALVADFDLTAQAPPADALKRLSLDPYDASLWVAGEKTVLHVSTQGQMLLKWTSSQNIQAIGLDPDQSLWALTQNGLYQVSVAGTVLSNLALPNTLIPDPTFLAVDGLGGYLWVAGKKTLLRLDANDLTKPPLTAALPATVNGTNNKLEALLTHPIFGTVWAASTDTLLLYDRDAGLVRQVSLTPQALGIPQAMAYEYGSASLWLGGKTALGRFTPNGDYVTKLPADIAISAIATGPFSVSPKLTLLSPLDNSLTNNPRPPFRLGLGASCNGIPCQLVPAYLDSVSLAVDLNGQVVGPLFTLSNGEARYTPAARLPEGMNLLNAQARDIFGHVSEPLTGRFTIDTIPPRFVTVTPDDGGVLGVPEATIQGGLDDPTASTLLQDQTGQVLGMASGATFSFAVTLAPGINLFTLIARDPAGNETRAALRLTLAVGAVAVRITSPANGASLATNEVLVSGTFYGPANSGVTVNGVPALTFGSQFFAKLSLVLGANTLSALATTPEGQTATHTVSVTVNRASPDPIRIDASPSSGVAPLKVRFSVSDAGGSPRSIQVDFDGNGSIDFATTDPNTLIEHTYTAPGVYLARVTVTDSLNATSTQTVAIVVYDATQMDRLFMGLWEAMNNALKAGDVAKAAQFLNESAKRKYRPVFEVLLPYMTEIIASYSPLTRVSISGDIGEYAVNRTYNSQNRLYLIYFLKDSDGVWRVDAM